MEEKPLSQSDREKLLDSLGWKLLAELQADARISFAELGRRVGLSTRGCRTRAPHGG
jgi:DNA-binding Lrp family transcriptional regulator